MRDVWNDAMRHSILSRPFSCGVTVEPLRFRRSLRRYRIRYIRPVHTYCSDAASADPRFDAAREDIFARLNHLCARVKLGLSADALAQLLEAQL